MILVELQHLIYCSLYTCTTPTHRYDLTVRLDLLLVSEVDVLHEPVVQPVNVRHLLQWIKSNTNKSLGYKQFLANTQSTRFKHCK